MNPVKFKKPSRMQQIFALDIGEKFKFVATCSAQALRVDISRKNATLFAGKKSFTINETYEDGVRYLTVTRIKLREVKQHD